MMVVLLLFVLVYILGETRKLMYQCVSEML